MNRKDDTTTENHVLDDRGLQEGELRNTVTELLKLPMDVWPESPSTGSWSYNQDRGGRVDKQEGEIQFRMSGAGFRIQNSGRWGMLTVCRGSPPDHDP